MFPGFRCWTEIAFTTRSEQCLCPASNSITYEVLPLSFPHSRLFFGAVVTTSQEMDRRKGEIEKDCLDCRGELQRGLARRTELRRAIRKFSYFWLSGIAMSITASPK